MAVKKTVFFRC